MGSLFSLDIGASLEGMTLLIGLFSLGLSLGVLTGVFGVGGGFIVVPVLNVVFGIDYTIAKGSSLACMFGTAAGGLLKRLRLGDVARRTMMIIASGSMLGAAAGGYLNDWLENTVCGGDERRLTLVMHPLYIALLLASAWLVSRNKDFSQTGGTPLQKLPIGPRIRIRVADMDGVSLPGMVALGLLIGVLTGLLGVGGGVLMMPLLIGIVGLNPAQAVGTSLGIVMFASAAGTVKYALIDGVNLAVTMAIMFGAALGVQAGTAIGVRLRGSHLKKIFALLVLAVAVMVCVDLVKTAMSAPPTDRDRAPEPAAVVAPLTTDEP